VSRHSGDGRGTGRGDGTRVTHAGLPAPVPGEPLLPGPAFAAPFHLAGDPADAPYGYHRYGNPTWTAYERALGDLEDSDALVFASGTAAIQAALLPFLSPGDVLVAPRDAYPAVRALGEHLAARGVTVRWVATRDDEYAAALTDPATLVWAESPSNPTLDVVDIAALARLAHDAGAALVVDNTLATPLGQRPLDLGADVVVMAATKHLSGHADVLLGSVTTRDDARLTALSEWRGRGGAIAGPMEVWLAHRALPTLELRLDRGCANALALAEMLLAREDVTGVRYPGLAGDASHGVAAAQMTRFGTVLAFELETAERAQAFLGACEIIVEATSFGGVHSTAERRARWGTDDVSDGFIRFSAGIENVEDLLADVTGALDRSTD